MEPCFYEPYLHPSIVFFKHTAESCTECVRIFHRQRKLLEGYDAPFT